jgi:RNA polymerase sigma-70 factor, ECF subfamily
MGNLQPVVARMLEQLQGESTKRYQDYLLGGLEANQRKKIARLILTNENVFNELLAAEESLVEGYLDDTLPTDVHSRLVKLVASSRVWRQKIKLARALKTVAGLRTKADPTQVRNDLFESARVDLERLAIRYLRRERPGTFEPSDLVNEAYIKLQSRSANVDLLSRQHFLALAASEMRRLLIGYARKARSRRRENETDIPLQVDLPAEHSTETLLDLDMALTELATKDARQGRLVELIFFGGLSKEEAAKSLGISARTAQRVWSVARAWLHGRLQGRLSGS